MQNERPWTLDHEDVKPRMWHYYPKGDFEKAACGHPAIPGMPIVGKKPVVTIGTVSGVCERCWVRSQGKI